MGVGTCLIAPRQAQKAVADIEAAIERKPRPYGFEDAAHLVWAVGCLFGDVGLLVFYSVSKIYSGKPLMSRLGPGPSQYKNTGPDSNLMGISSTMLGTL